MRLLYIIRSNLAIMDPELVMTLTQMALGSGSIIEIDVENNAIRFIPPVSAPDSDDDGDDTIDLDSDDLGSDDLGSDDLNSEDLGSENFESDDTGDSDDNADAWFLHHAAAKLAARARTSAPKPKPKPAPRKDASRKAPVAHQRRTCQIDCCDRCTSEAKAKGNDDEVGCVDCGENYSDCDCPADYPADYPADCPADCPADGDDDDGTHGDVKVRPMTEDEAKKIRKQLDRELDEYQASNPARRAQSNDADV